MDLVVWLLACCCPSYFLGHDSTVNRNVFRLRSFHDQHVPTLAEEEPQGQTWEASAAPSRGVPPCVGPNNEDWLSELAICASGSAGIWKFPPMDRTPQNVVHKSFSTAVPSGSTSCAATFILQIERYACVYTSHVANLLFYSPNKSFKAPPDTMCHEDELVPPPAPPP